MTDETNKMLEGVVQDAAKNLMLLDAGSTEYVNTAQVMNDTMEKLQANQDSKIEEKNAKKQRIIDIAFKVGEGALAIGTFVGTLCFQHYWNQEYERFEETGVAKSTAHKEHRARNVKLPKFW